MSNKILNERSAHQLRVMEFMRRAGQDIPDKPTEPTPEVRLLRAKGKWVKPLDWKAPDLAAEIERQKGLP